MTATEINVFVISLLFKTYMHNALPSRADDMVESSLVHEPGVKSALPAFRITGELCERITYDPDRRPVTSRLLGVHITPCRIQRWEVQEQPTGLLGSISNIFRGRIQTATQQQLSVPTESGKIRSLKIRPMPNASYGLGVMVEPLGGAEPDSSIVSRLFPNGTRKKIKDSHSVLIQDLQAADIEEALLHAQVYEHNSRFPYELSQETKGFFREDESAVKEYLEKNLDIHGTWFDLCKMTGYVHKHPPLYIEDRSSEGKQYVEKIGHEIIPLAPQSIYGSSDTFTLSQSSTLALPLRMWHERGHDQDYISTVVHEMGHIITENAPKQLSEGITELLLRELVLRNSKYKGLSDVHGVTSPRQLFPGNADEGFNVGQWGTNPKFHSVFHAVNGWGMAAALAEALGNDAGNIRKLVSCCVKKNATDLPPDIDTWLHDVDEKIPGFSNRFRKTGALVLQKPGRKVYWAESLDHWGSLASYDMTGDIQHGYVAHEIPLQIRIQSGGKTVALPCKSGYVSISSETIHAYLDFLHEHDMVSLCKSGFRIEVASPDDPSQWKDIGQTFTLES
jgi:hypothetical protein